MKKIRMFTRREFLHGTAAAAGTAAMMVPGCRSILSRPANAVSGDKPNIILIMIDNIGFADIGINGNKLVKTPHLDRFAREGVQFDRFYSNPLCAPTRACLMTGRYHYRTGVIHTSRGGAKMHGDEVTIANFLKKDGYATGIFGKWHLGDNYPMRPQDQGFDETLIHKSGRLGQVPDAPNTYIDPKLWHNGQRVQTQGYCTNVFTDATMNFIEKHRKQPFFVYLPTNIGHSASDVGLEVPKKYSAPYKAMGLNDKVATACGMIDNLDENFGRLLDRLDSLRLRENTLIIFLSDDGNVRINTGGLRGIGYSNLYDGSLKAPCFAQWPGRFPGGLKIDKVTSHIDILPTLLDACAIKTNSTPTIDGVSLLNLLKGKTEQWSDDRMLFLQCHRGLTPQRYQNCAVVTQRFKLIGYPNTFSQRKLKTSRDNPILELYDLATDPKEEKNVAEKYPEMVAKLRMAYDKWFDDVKGSRGFTPGCIHLGSDAENPTYLCRYQDSSYIDQKPTGWPVYIERSGKYELTINRGDSLEKTRMFVKLGKKTISQPLDQGKSKAVFTLPSIRAKLNVWVQEQGKPYVPRSVEDKIGDVIVRRIDHN